MNMIYEVHTYLNALYGFAEEIEAHMRECYPKVKLEMHKGHYIKLKKEYVYQKYPLPVVIIEGIGDIGVNLDKVWIEFFVKRENVIGIPFEKLIEDYEMECYGGKDCLQDFYQEGDTEEDIKSKLQHSEEEWIGLAFYIREEKVAGKIKEVFNKVRGIVEKGKHGV